MTLTNSNVAFETDRMFGSEKLFVSVFQSFAGFFGEYYCRNCSASEAPEPLGEQRTESVVNGKRYICLGVGEGKREGKHLLANKKGGGGAEVGEEREGIFKV